MGEGHFFQLHRPLLLLEHLQKAREREGGGEGGGNEWWWWGGVSDHEAEGRAPPCPALPRAQKKRPTKDAA